MLESNYKIAAKSTFLIASIAIFSKGLGFVKELVMAALFGARWQTDSYNMALGVKGIILSLIAVSITFIIPMLNETKNEKQESLFFSNISTILTVLACFLSVVGFFAAEYVIKLFAPGFDSRRIILSATIFRIFAVTMPLSMIYRIQSETLDSKFKYAYANIFNILEKILILIVCVVLYFLRSRNIIAVSLASSIAILIAVLLSGRAISKLSIKYKPHIDVKDSLVRKLFWLGIPSYITVFSTQINSYISKSLASGLAVGSVSVIGYSQKLMMLIPGLIIVPISTVFFSHVSKKASKENAESLIWPLQKSFEIILFICIPIVIIAMSFPYEIVSIVYVRGAFTDEVARITAPVFFWHMLMVIAIGTNAIIRPCYYSIKNSKMPAIAAVTGMIFNVTTSIILQNRMGIQGLIIGAVTGSTVSCAILYAALPRFVSVTFNQIKPTIIQCLKILLCGLICIVVCALSRALIHVDNFIIMLSISTAMAGTAYLLMSYFLKIQALHQAIDLLRSMPRKIA